MKNVKVTYGNKESKIMFLSDEQIKDRLRINEESKKHSSKEPYITLEVLK